jgi:hypothetical protein
MARCMLKTEFYKIPEKLFIPQRNMDTMNSGIWCKKNISLKTQF